MNKPDTSDIVKEIKSIAKNIDISLNEELHDLLMTQIFDEMVDIKIDLDIIIY